MGVDMKTSKDCPHCIAYNVDHCAARECQGALTVLRPRKQWLPDEDIRDFYEHTLLMFQNDFSQNSEVEK